MKRRLTDKEVGHSLTKKMKPWTWKTCDCCDSEFKREWGWHLEYSLFWIDSPIHPFHCSYYFCLECAPDKDAVYKWYEKNARKKAPSRREG